MLPPKLERARVRHGEFASDPAWGPYGLFILDGPCGAPLKIVASGAGELIAMGWEHASVSTPRRAPNWQEMCFTKELFWALDECVIQFHPPAAAYINNHPFCLRLWKPPYSLGLPPAILVGIKDEGLMTAERAEEIRRERFGDRVPRV